MTFLQLCQRLAQECGVSGTLTTTVGQVGSLGRIVTWVNQAFTELQTEHDDWNFLRSSNLLGAGVSFTTVAGQSSYPLGTGVGTCGISASTFDKWDLESFRNYTTTVGFTNETFLDYIPYDVWRDSYQLGAMRTVQTRPVAVAIGPDKSVCLGPPPNGLYTITGDYFVAPTAMSADTDTPTGLPAQFQIAIIYKAMMYYGAYESAPEVYQRGAQGWSLILAQLEATNTPMISFGGALC